VVTDGVDLHEAQLLATAYFHRFISGCGYVGTPQRRGKNWKVDVFEGYAGTPMSPIFVDAHTGAISRHNCATVYPKDFAS
jgi:hypothetical protein